MNVRNTVTKTRKSIWALALLMALGAFQQPAYGKSKKQTGDSGVESQLRFKAGDESGNELKALKTEMLVMRSEKKALDQMHKLLKKHTNTHMEPEMIYRLAELYMRRARTERFFEVHRGSDQVMTFAPKMVKDASEAKEIRKAISYYQRMQEKFPKFRAIDIVIFNNAYAHSQIGESKDAEKLLLRLVSEHYRSPLVPDAYLSLGEIAYSNRNFTLALERFKAIRKYPEARVYPYGLYKAAWSYYNLQDAKSGMAQLEEVVKFGRQVALQKLDSKLDLRKEALGDLALFYGDVKQAPGAVDYFREQAQEIDAVPYLLRLVELYKRHSRYGDVELVLKSILAKMPHSPAIATVHEELAWNYERTKKPEAAVAQLEAFEKYCVQHIPKAKSLKKGEVQPRAECQDKISETSKKLAVKWHAQWKKFGGDTFAPASEKAYRLYLRMADSQDKELPTMHFAMAELLFARGQFREASEHYASIETYQINGVAIDPKVAHDASYAAIVGLEKAVGDKWSDDDEKRFVTLSDSYVKRFPKGAYVLEIRFKRAFIAYEKERYDEAAPLLKAIGWMDVPAGQAVSEKISKAQDLYLDILNVRKDYKGLKEAAQSLLTRGTQGGRTTQVEKIYREAFFAEIQQMEEKGELAAAIDAYKKFALENAQSELAPKAWWNASQLQFRMGDATGGANTCYQMHKLFPKSSNGRDCLTKAAQTFEAMGRLDLAGKVLLNLATVEDGDQLKWREVAADFFAMSGGKDRAITMYQKLAEGQKPAKQLPLLEKAAMLARDLGDMKTLGKIENQYSQMGIEPQASRMIVEQAEEAFERADLTKAFNLSKKIIGRESLPKDLLARARFVQARVLEDEYRKQSVKARLDRVGMVLALKTEKLEKAQKAYQSAIRYGDPTVSVKSFQRLADCYLEYSTSVRGLTVKGGLSDADMQAFRGEIEQLAVPMEEKGIEAMNQALDAARKAQLRDGQIAKLQTEVNRLNLKTSHAPAVVVVSPIVYVPEFRGPASNHVQQPASKGVVQ